MGTAKPEGHNQDKTADANVPEEAEENTGPKVDETYGEKKTVASEESESKKVHQSPFLTKAVPKKEDVKNDGEGVEISTVEIAEKQEKFLEENQKDEVLFRGRCKLYYLSDKTKKLEERGEGNIIVSLHGEKNLVKITMIRDQIMRLGCNHFINPNFELQPNNKLENAWVWGSTEDTVESDAPQGKNQIFLVKFYSEKESRGFKEEYDLGRAHNERVLKANKKK